MELSNDHGVTVGFSINVSVTLIVASVFVLDVQIPAVVTASEIVSVPNLEFG